MTTLEIILIAIIWIGYGLFAAYQSREMNLNSEDQSGMYIVYIVFAPMIFILKCLYGAFKKYE